MQDFFFLENSIGFGNYKAVQIARKTYKDLIVVF